jgi:hypothetical protein
VISVLVLAPGPPEDWVAAHSARWAHQLQHGRPPAQMAAEFRAVARAEGRTRARVRRIRGA